MLRNSEELTFVQYLALPVVLGVGIIYPYLTHEEVKTPQVLTQSLVGDLCPWAGAENRACLSSPWTVTPGTWPICKGLSLPLGCITEGTMPWVPSVLAARPHCSLSEEATPTETQRPYSPLPVLSALSPGGCDSHWSPLASDQGFRRTFLYILAPPANGPLTGHRKGCWETTSHLLSQDGRVCGGLPTQASPAPPRPGLDRPLGLVTEGNLVQSLTPRMPVLWDRDQILVHGCGGKNCDSELALCFVWLPPLSQVPSSASGTNTMAPGHKSGPILLPPAHVQLVVLLFLLAQERTQMPALGQACSLSLEDHPAPSLVSLASPHTALMVL